MLTQRETIRNRQFGSVYVNRTALMLAYLMYEAHAANMHVTPPKNSPFGFGWVRLKFVAWSKKEPRTGASVFGAVRGGVTLSFSQPGRSYIRD